MELYIYLAVVFFWPTVPLGPRRSVTRSEWEYHTVSDQLPDWVLCGYWKCECF